MADELKNDNQTRRSGMWMYDRLQQVNGAPGVLCVTLYRTFQDWVTPGQKIRIEARVVDGQDAIVITKADS